MDPKLKQLMIRIVSKMNHMIRYGHISQTIDDSGDKQIANIVEFKNKNTQVQLIYPYGFAAKPPVATKLLRFLINGNPNNSVGIAFLQKKRFKSLEDSDVVIFNPETRAFIKFDASGKIIIETNGSIEVKANQVDVDASQVNLGVGGQPIARVGDTVTIGSETGTITSGGNNTSI